MGDEDGVKKTPEWAAKISGIKAETIKVLAHDLKAHRTMLMIGWGIQRIDYGEQFHWMLVTLAAALGQIGLRYELSLLFRRRASCKRPRRGRHSE